MEKGAKVNLVHNRILFIIIIILIILFIFIIVFVSKENNNQNQVYECSKDNECFKDSCCHANSCVAIDKKPVCDKIMCSQDCSGVLDCNNAGCACINNKCSVKLNKQ